MMLGVDSTNFIFQMPWLPRCWFYQLGTLSGIGKCVRQERSFFKFSVCICIPSIFNNSQHNLTMPHQDVNSSQAHQTLLSIWPYALKCSRLCFPISVFTSSEMSLLEVLVTSHLPFCCSSSRDASFFLRI